MNCLSPDPPNRARRHRMVVAAMMSAFAFLAAALPVHGEQRFPDVVAAKATPHSGGIYDFDVTISSPYDTPQRYADAFRVKTVEGKVLGERVLLHDHATEQPFTRDLYGVRVPEGIARIVVEGRDRANGWGGTTLQITLPGR